MTDHRREFLLNCIPLDTETTSLDFKVAEVIELGYVIKLQDGWHIVNNLYKPAHGIVEHEISAITHITQKMVENKPFFGKSIECDLNVILDTIVGCGNLIAHNAFYDSKVLENYPIRDTKTPWLCTMRIAKKLYGDDDTVKQFNLPYLRYRFDLTLGDDIEHHRAGSDAYMTALLLEVFLTEMEERGIIDKTLPYREQVEAWLAEPVKITKMPFGKWKGTPLENVPLSYWKWAIANLDTLDEDKDEYDTDFATSVAEVLEKLM